MVESAQAELKQRGIDTAQMPVPPDAFERADTNKDGVIDQAEAEAALKAMMRGPNGHRGHHGKGGPDDGDENTQGGN
jgi:hypothetical protein